MSFAVFYEMPDLAAIGGFLNSDGLTVDQRNLARRYWDGGFSAFADSPLSDAPYNVDCAACHTVVIGYGTLAGFSALLADIGAALGGDALYMIAIAEDMLGTGVDPWPAA